MAFFALAEVNAGHRSEGRRVLDELEQIRKKQYVDPFSVLELCAALNDEKSLHLWLKRMEEERSTIYVYLDVFMRAYVQDTLAKAKSQ